MTTVESIPTATVARHEVTRAHVRGTLTAAVGDLTLGGVRDVVCDWLASRGQWNGQPSERRFDIHDDPVDFDSRALDRCATLAHRDPGHIGRLDTCTEELCRALSDAGAD